MSSAEEPQRVYVDSSALLEAVIADDEEIRGELKQVVRPFASVLTQLECNRVLSRKYALGEVTKERYELKKQQLDKFLSGIELLEITSPVIERAGRAFLMEPVRSLDAIHLSTAVLSSAPISTAMLTLDRRIRENAPMLGIHVLPKDASKWLDREQKPKKKAKPSRRAKRQK